MKLVQIETFYDFYLSAFYQSRPDLKTAPYQTQLDALLAGGFAAAHVFAPQMRRVGYDAHYIIANCAPLQFAWMREHGHAIPQTGDVRAEILRRQIEELAPDVLYSNDAPLFDSAFMRTLTPRPRLIMGWHASPIPAQTDWSEYDVILSPLANLRALAVGKLGARSAEPFLPAFPEWIAGPVEDVQPSYDVAFSGQYTVHQHARRGAYMARLAETAAQDGFDLRLLLSGQTNAVPEAMRRFCHPPVYGVDMYRSLRGARIAIDSRSDMVHVDAATGTRYDLAGRETANMRLFEATGAGAFLLAERFDNLASLFELGREIETFANEAEMVEKVRYYLSHPDERQAIAERGRERTRRDHSMGQRIRWLDSIIRRHLAAARPAPVQTPVVAPAPVSQPAPAAPAAPVTVHTLKQKLMERISVISIDGMERIGTVYGGWVVPLWRVTPQSVCYCVGAGEDISFDVGLMRRTGCTVHTFDPTPRARLHYDGLANAARQGLSFPINNSSSEFYPADPAIAEKVKFFPWGLYDRDEVIRFFAPRDKTHVSHSIKNLQKTEEYFDAQCYKLTTIMEKLGHSRIDMLKIDIEGAEYDVIKSVIEQKVRPGVFAIEFDEGYHPSDVNFINRIFQSLRSLERYGYALVSVDSWTFTFTDICSSSFSA